MLSDGDVAALVVVLLRLALDPVAASSRADIELTLQSLIDPIELDAVDLVSCCPFVPAPTLLTIVTRSAARSSKRSSLSTTARKPASSSNCCALSLIFRREARHCATGSPGPCSSTFQTPWRQCVFPFVSSRLLALIGLSDLDLSAERLRDCSVIRPDQGFARKPCRRRLLPRLERDGRRRALLPLDDPLARHGRPRRLATRA